MKVHNNINLDNRKELAKKKGLIVSDDYSLYRQIFNMYQKAFQYILNQAVDFSFYDGQIQKANLYFTFSFKACEFMKDRMLSSHYFYCLNMFYIEKLSPEDISILRNANSINEDVLSVVRKTYKEIIHKDHVQSITYGPALPQRIVKNDTIVLEIILGKTDYDMDIPSFLENKKRQEEFLEKLVEEIENQIKNVLTTEVKILISRSV